MKTNYCLLSLIGIFATGCSKQNISEPQVPLQKTNSVVVEAVAPVLVVDTKPVHIEEKVDEVKLEVIVPVKSTSVGRIWTSIDGRTIEAELLARTEDVIKIRRNSDQKEFSLPIKNISELDRNYVINSAIPVTIVAKIVEAPVKVVPKFNEAALAALKSSIPAISPNAPLDGSDQNLVTFFSSYKRSIESISFVGFDSHIKIIRDKMNSDIKKLTPTAESRLVNPPVYDSYSCRWITGSGAWKEVWAARSILSWLKGPLNNHIVRMESLK